MANRPVFMPSDGPSLVNIVSVDFHWHAGMAPSQKQKNVTALHDAAFDLGYSPLLEISSKSQIEAGQRLSAFYLSLRIGTRDVSVECAFQGSKVFENGGPYTDLYSATSKEAKRDDRIRTSGRLIGFNFLGEEFPLYPPTAFYDFLYLNALDRFRDWLRRLEQFKGFTDIEFNPAKSINCQARSCALFVSLMRRGKLDDAVESFGQFLNIIRDS